MIADRLNYEDFAPIKVKLDETLNSKLIDLLTNHGPENIAEISKNKRKSKKVHKAGSGNSLVH